MCAKGLSLDKRAVVAADSVEELLGKLRLQQGVNGVHAFGHIGERDAHLREPTQRLWADVAVDISNVLAQPDKRRLDVGGVQLCLEPVVR